jgi:hypothetical protein
MILSLFLIQGARTKGEEEQFLPDLVCDAEGLYSKV